MLKVTFTKREFEKLLEVIYFTPLQERIMHYRVEEKTRTEMADEEHCSVITIDREIKKIAEKIKKAYDDNLIVFW